MLLLYEKRNINIVKTFQERDRMEKHKTRDNMDLYSHLLWFAQGLYMPTATLLNGQLFNGGLKILLFNAYMSKYYGLLSLFSITCIKKLSIASFQAPRYTKIEHKIIADINFMHAFFDYARCFRQSCPT